MLRGRARLTLRAALGNDAVKDGESERDLHGADLSFHEPHRPDLVVYPSSTAEVAEVLAIANERRIPVTPFGVGTSLEGHIIPVHGGITLDLSRLDRIVDLSPATADKIGITPNEGVAKVAVEPVALPPRGEGARD